MATYSLRDLLTSDAPITVGGILLSDFRNHSHVPPVEIFIDTVEGAETGINVRLSPRLSDTIDTRAIGFTFLATASTPILGGASMDLDGFSFTAPETGGQVVASLSEAQRLPDRIGIDLLLNNAPGAPDLLSGSDIIRGGALPSFGFDYVMSQTGPGHVGVTEIRFDTLPPGFDGLQYIASYPDLAAALGANRAAGETHYLAAGRAEGRQVDLFNETQYLKNNGDLQAAFGTNVDQATVHYITNGLNEGRTDDAPSPSQIDGLQYVASNPDLIAAFGANAAAGQQHYAQNGQAQSRVLDNFDETQYVANYAELQAAFGTNTEAATAHYIQFGFAEGRTDFIV